MPELDQELCFNMVQPTSGHVSMSPVAAPVVLPPASQSTQINSVDEPAPLPQIQRRSIWGVPFDCLTLKESVDRIEALIDRGVPSYVITANLNYVMLHHQQADVPEITDSAALILADGQPIVWRSKLGSSRLPERVAGSEMIHHLACRAGHRKWGVYFLGGQPGVAEKCAKRLARDYPGLRIAGIESPPYRRLTDSEVAAQQKRIRDADPQLLLVAFGQPKGERWIYENYQRLGVPISIQLGASFDFIAGTAKRAPTVWQNMGAEWVYRMCSDPKRLIPRYWSNACFLGGALVDDWKQTVRSWGMGLDSK